MTGRRLGLVGLAVLFGVAWWWRRPADEFALPPAIHLETIAAHLAETLPPEVVAAQPADDPVRLGSLQPGDGLAAGNARPAVQAPAPSTLRFRVTVPADGALRFGVGVAGGKKRDDTRSGVRFAVRVDDREIWSRTLNPAATRHDRKWRDERVDLAPWAGRAVTLGFDTALASPGKPAAGTPGWSRLRLVTAPSVPRQPAGPGAPNLLVITVDTLRADRLGCYGHTPSPSATLDAFAARGRLFEQSIAQSSWTLPSVASLFTGLHPRSHGVLMRDPDRPGQKVDANAAHLADTLETWAERASAAGITTMGIAANPLVSRDTNLAQGFETWHQFGFDEQLKNWHGAPELNDVFLRWLDRNRAYRFAAYLHYMEPHAPYLPKGMAPAPGQRRPIAEGRPSVFARKVNARQAPPLPAGEIEFLLGLYDREIAAWDRAFAELLRALEARGVLASTVIIVTSDHGEEFQEHGDLTHGTHLYDELVRVPLIAVGPGIAPARVTTQAQSLDLFPTVAGVLGFAPPSGLPGSDLLSARTPVAVLSETRDAVSPQGTFMTLLSLRRDGWKLIHAPALGAFELYDLRQDPGEHTNRFGAAPGVRDLVGVLEAWTATVPPPPKADGADPGLQDKLKALGYVH